MKANQVIQRKRYTIYMNLTDENQKKKLEADNNSIQRRHYKRYFGVKTPGVL